MWQRKGDGNERRHVAVEEEGERERLSDPHHDEEVPRERDVAKRRKNMEERRTDRLFFLYDCPHPFVPPRPLLPPRNDRSDRMGTKTVKGPFSWTDGLGPVRLTEPWLVFVEPYMCVCVLVLFLGFSFGLGLKWASPSLRPITGPIYIIVSAVLRI